jgi:hypothetical protein
LRLSCAIRVDNIEHNINLPSYTPILQSWLCSGLFANWQRISHYYSIDYRSRKSGHSLEMTIAALRVLNGCHKMSSFPFDRPCLSLQTLAIAVLRFRYSQWLFSYCRGIRIEATLLLNHYILAKRLGGHILLSVQGKCTCRIATNLNLILNVISFNSRPQVNFKKAATNLTTWKCS